MYQTDNLSHADALKITNAIQAELDRTDSGAAVAVADAHGELIAFLRTDGCKLPSITIAINKAFTASRERVESKDVGKASRAEQFPMTNFGDLRYTAWGGGVPIQVNNRVIGAVAVSGLTEDEDMELARMGAALIS